MRVLFRMTGFASCVMIPVRWLNVLFSASNWVRIVLFSITGSAPGPMTWIARSPLSRIVLFAIRGEHWRMSMVVEPHAKSVHSITDPTDPWSWMETQSFRSGNGSSEVNVTWRSGRPTERIVPDTTMEWDAGGVVSNRTCTPGSRVRRTPSGTRTSPVTTYGLPGIVHVVLAVRVPETSVGPAVAVLSSGAGIESSTTTRRNARTGIATRRTTVVP